MFLAFFFQLALVLQLDVPLTLSLALVLLKLVSNNRRFITETVVKVRILTCSLFLAAVSNALGLAAPDEETELEKLFVDALVDTAAVFALLLRPVCEVVGAEGAKDACKDAARAELEGWF